jgi:S-adenosylmethionine:tRNA ribosyltransferase-isomerase
MRGWTSLAIAPGDPFRVVGVLLTNFHLPGSSPLRLTIAFAGEPALRRAYAAAMHERYRLLSYGDAMLIV